MANFTRRTHIVRISDAEPGEPPSDTYIDIEVLDAISFRDTNGKEMILNMPAAKVVACIKDNTGGGHGKRPNNPTRLSHMERIVGDDPTQKIDVEVIDILSFRDANNTEWILDMNSTNGRPSVFNSTDRTGDIRSSRRTHSEKLAEDQTELNPAEFVTVERCDSIAFRTVLGKEMIIKCPSTDDPRVQGSRASTFVWSPRNYNPNNPNGPVPPTNTDDNVYAAFVKGADGKPLSFLTGKTKIAQGPFWWIRKVSVGKVYLQLDILTSDTVKGGVYPPVPTIEINLGDLKDGEPHAKLLDRTDIITNKRSTPRDTTVYFVWNSFAPFPTPETSHVEVSPIFCSYAAQFSQYLIDGKSAIPRPSLAEPSDKIGSVGAVGGGDFFTGGNYNGNGMFPSLEAAEYYANIFNAEYDGMSYPEARGPAGMFKGYFAPGDTDPTFTSETRETVYAASLEIPNLGATASTTVKTSLLFALPTPETVIKLTVGSRVLGIRSLAAAGYSDVKKALQTLDDAALIIPDTPVRPPDVITATNTALSTTFTITTEVIKNNDPATEATKAHHVQIVIVGGRRSNLEG